MDRLYPLTEVLVLRAQAGEREAFATLASLWSPILLAHAKRLSCGFADGGDDLAEDAAQDAWASIARRLGGLDDPRAFGAWAMRIVARRVADRARRRSRERRRMSASASPPGRDAAAAGDGGSDADPAGRLDDQAALARMRLALAGLAPGDRLLLVAAYERGMSVAEMSRFTGVKRGTVKSRLHRARRRLRVAMERTDRYANPHDE
jgi:RNA polymerase sigma-70 factor (ECF subfamily)